MRHPARDRGTTAWQRPALPYRLTHASPSGEAGRLRIPMAIRWTTRMTKAKWRRRRRMKADTPIHRIIRPDPTWRGPNAGVMADSNGVKYD